MLRFLFALILVVAVALAVDWVASQPPGSVRVEGFGYKMNVSAQILLGILGVLLAIYTLAVLVVRRLLLSPRDIREGWRSQQRRRGYRALTQGMVAVAAGDPQEALRWSKRAGDMLDDPPLTLLLAAQSAQLDGDARAASRYFHMMLEQPETRFLGLRGLVQIALREGDEEAALEYVKEAYNLRPNTPWVLDALFDLAERRGRLEEAVRALDEARRRKALPRSDINRKRAVLLYEEAKAASDKKETLRAIDKAKQALKLSPDFVAAVVLLSDSYVAASRHKDAERALRRAWAQAPHPDLYKAWKRTRPSAEQPEIRKKTLLRFISGQPEHVETRLVLADSALESGDWAESRNELQSAEDKAADARVAELLARLEQAEHGDAAAARSWLETAAGRPAAPSWICEVCRHEAEIWMPRCSACGSFDSLAWRAGKPLPESGIALSPSSGDPAGKSLFAPVIIAEEKEETPDPRAAAPPPAEAEAPRARPLITAQSADTPETPSTPEERARQLK